MDSIHEKTSSAFIAIESIQNKINQNNHHITLTNHAVQLKNAELKRNAEYIAYLEKELQKLHLNRELAYKRIVSYEQNIEDIKAKAACDLAIERAIRAEDLTYLSGLWPNCCIMPSLLRPFSPHVAEDGINPEDIYNSNISKSSNKERHGSEYGDIDCCISSNDLTTSDESCTSSLDELKKKAE